MEYFDFILAKDFHKRPKNNDDYNPPIGWDMSEKLDGYRARYIPDKKQFISRQNKYFNSPKWFTEWFPDIHLDGELYAAKKNFEYMGIVRKKEPVDEEWINIKYYIYDLPEMNDIFMNRYKEMKNLINEIEKTWDKYKLSLDEKYHDLDCPIVLVDQIKIKTIKQMETFYNKIIKNGGEGIMIRDPNSKYENKRSNHLLKYKPLDEDEAQIIGYNPGSGKYKNKLGSFIVKPLINKTL